MNRPRTGPRPRISSRPPMSVRVLVLLVALAAGLSACATIPTTGPVLSGNQINGDPRDGVSGGSGLLPDGPAPGADPVGVVSGFLQAAAGFAGYHRVARAFLTPQRALTWQPDASVQIYPRRDSLRIKKVGEPKPASTAEPTVTPQAGGGAVDVPADQITKVTVHTPIDAEIDQDGRYSPAPPGRIITVTFSLIHAHGEWRITDLPNGILVGRNVFDVSFRSFPVYFADRTGQFLVPDLHWFPGSRDEPGSPELPTALVRVLLQGPPTWLQGAVRTGAPPDTRMAVGAVVVADDVATVDLTDPVRKASARDRQLLAYQLTATLGQLRTVSTVQITVRGLTFDVPAGGSRGGGGDDPSSQPASQPVVDPKVSSRPVMIDPKGRLAWLDGRTLVPVKDVAGLAVDGANRPAVSSDGSSFAVLNRRRTRLLLQLPGTQVVTLVKSQNLTAPSFDPQGAVWTSPGTADGYVYAAGAGAGAVQVAAPWLQHVDVVALRISRDGTRAAIAVRDADRADRARVYVSGVVRDDLGRPESLTPPVGLLPAAQSVVDLAWMDEDQIVVLARTTTDPVLRPWMVQIGGDVRPGTEVEGAENITAGNGELMLMIGRAKGSVARSGRLWDDVTAARWPSFPG
jgi:Lipoprotein LpqB beta-propeller domain/Sporulation and spore germination